MANIISTNVYNFSTTGNSYASKTLMGLPSAGAVIGPASSPDSRVFVYSSIRYPHLGMANVPYLTAETVAALITKANA